MTQPDLFDNKPVTPMEFAMARPDIFPVDFRYWLRDNVHVWSAFVREAQRVIDKGFRHYSARTIIHVLRHHSALEEKGGEYKVNNNHSPYLARLFDLVYPAHAGLWEYRETKKVRTQ